MPLNLKIKLNRNHLVSLGTVIFLSLAFVAIPEVGNVRADDNVSLSERIQRIEDEKEIRDLMMEYGLCLDRRDFIGYSQLFAKEGEWSGFLGKPVTIRGREEIRTTMEQAFSESPYNPDNITSFHLVSNIKIDVNGDRATGYSRWTVAYRNEDDRPVVTLGGRYDDIYIRQNGNWKFLKRSAVREIP